MSIRERLGQLNAAKVKIADIAGKDKFRFGHISLLLKVQCIARIA